MDEYVVGSVADLISNIKTIPMKPKKEKNKLSTDNENQKMNKNSELQKPINDALEVKKKKKKNKLKEFSEQVISSVCVEAPEKEINNLLPQVDIKSERKKRKKSNIKDQEEQVIFSECVEAPEKEINNLLPQVDIKSERKKRKKSNTKDQDDPLPKKTKIELPEEDHVPTDSENEGEIKDKNSKKKKQKKSKKNLENNDVNENTVFIGNIPINFDKQKICKQFSKFGEIQNARIRCVPIADINMSKKVAAIKKTFNPKRNSLVAYVNFKSLESAKAAVNANGMVIDGHHLRIDFANSSNERDNNKAIFVGGLPFDIEDDELWEFFEKCGKINSVRVVRDSQTLMGKGFGYVNFDSTTSVELALQMNGQELKKRVINVKRCVNSRNKNKLNSFGRKKSKEIANELLCKRGKKFKEEKNKLKKEKKSQIAFQGKTANMKQKKKKKLSKAALRQRKLVKILGAS